MDSRWQTTNPALVKLIDDQGSQIAAGAINVSGGGSPTPCQCIAEADALTSTAASVSNVNQVISPTAPAAKTARKFRRLGRAHR
jgi:hypothetical protein